MLAAVLPPTMEDIPSSYAQTGHIAHVNLRDEALPYKRIIGEVILSVRLYVLQEHWGFCNTGAVLMVLCRRTRRSGR